MLDGARRACVPAAQVLFEIRSAAAPASAGTGNSYSESSDRFMPMRNFPYRQMYKSLDTVFRRYEVVGLIFGGFHPPYILESDDLTISINR